MTNGWKIFENGENTPCKSGLCMINVYFFSLQITKKRVEKEFEGKETDINKIVVVLSPP